MPDKTWDTLNFLILNWTCSHCGSHDFTVYANELIRFEQTVVGNELQDTNDLITTRALENIQCADCNRMEAPVTALLRLDYK